MSLRPLDGRMSGGLADGHVVVTGETADGQVPEALELRVKEGELAPPPPKMIPLGKAGYATFPLQLMSLNTLMELHHEGSSAWRSFNLESIQFSIELESPVITPGTLPFVLHSALSSGPVFVDLWWGDRWISSTAMELDGVRVEGQLEIPDYLPDGAIVWMRAYRSAYLPERGKGFATYWCIAETRNPPPVLLSSSSTMAMVQKLSFDVSLKIPTRISPIFVRCLDFYLGSRWTPSSGGCNLR